MKRAAIVGVAVAGAIVLAGAGIVWWLLPREDTAEGAAHAYLDALAGGDLDTIQEMRQPLPEAQEKLLERAFRSAAGYITQPRIDRLEERGDGVVAVRASAELDGARTELSFEIEQDDSGWVVSGDHLGTLTIDAAMSDGQPLERVLVGDALAPASTPLALLPAEYVVMAAPSGFLEGSVEVAVPGGQAAGASLTAALAPGAAGVVQEHLDAYADTCAAPADAVPEHCGIVVPWAADLASLDRIAFRIEQYPAAAVGSDGRSFDATGGVLVATAHGTTREGDAASITYRTDDWSLRGDVELDGDRVVVSIR